MTIPPDDPKLIHPLFPRFGPCQDCCYYLDLDNYITLDGTYPVKNTLQRRQRLYCHAGEHRFSETAYSPLLGHHGSFKEYVQTAKMSSYGLSTNQIADVLERDRRTILEWQKALGYKCKRFHLALCSLIGLTLMSIQMDEIWSSLKKKKRQLWLFITIESKTKFWVNFEVGSRTSHTAHRLLNNLVSLMPWGFEHFRACDNRSISSLRNSDCARRTSKADRQLLGESSLRLSSNCQKTSKKKTCNGQTKDNQGSRD